MKAIKWLDKHFEETLLIVLLVLISCVQLAQVIVRNVPFIPALKWAEEFSRFCWIWSVFLSLPYTLRKASMLRVSTLLDVFPQVARKILNIIIDLVNAAVMLLLGVHSVSVVRGIVESGETSPAMLWPMWIVYSIMLVSFFLAVLRALQQTFIHIRGFGEKELNMAEKTMLEAEEEAESGRRAEGRN